MSKPIVFMYSGQGSQYYQMGRELFLQDAVFNNWVNKGNDIYKKFTGSSIIDIIYNDNQKKSDPFMRTLFTHPAIFIIEYAMTQVLLNRNIIPNYVLGASLGEFVAATVAGVFNFETALEAVITQAQIIEKKCHLGSMLAILHSDSLYSEDFFIQENSEIAAFNFTNHFIISSDVTQLQTIKALLNCKQIISQTITVNHGFHSTLIDNAGADYLHYIKRQVLQTPILPFISCAYATRLAVLSGAHFWDIVRLPIQFSKTIQMMENNDNYLYVDLGSSGTLATFVKYNLTSHSSSKSVALLTPFGDFTTNLNKLSAIINEIY